MGGRWIDYFFASRGCSETTVESDDVWAKRIQTRLATLPASCRDSVTLRVIPAHASAHSDDFAYIHSVLDGGPWDVVVVDGLEEPFRNRMDCVSCIARHPEVLNDLGCVVLDDARRPQYSDADNLLAELQATRLWGLGPCRWGVTSTALFWKDRRGIVHDNNCLE